MSDESTKFMLEAYREAQPASRFFTGFFKPKFYPTEKVEVDVVRSDEEVSIVISDISTGPRMNSADIYSNKEFAAPIHEEAIPLNVFDLIKRTAGSNPFADKNFQRDATIRMFDGMVKIEAKIRRSIEWQASQVMQSGTVTLKDGNGTALYTIDYSPKATHFPTASPVWDAAGDDKMGDILILAGLNRADGLAKSDQLVFGETAFQSFIKDADVRALLDNRRMEIGGIRPEGLPDEATFQGRITIGDYTFVMITLPSRYRDPETGVSTPFMNPTKVIVRDSTARMDGTFGDIPSIVPPDSRVLQFMPPRIQGGGIDLIPNVWVSANGKNLFASVASRPLMIPIAIDSYGCLETGL